jgi:hypothetical protein
MRRYNNSFRMVHYNSANMGDAITTIDKSTYDDLRKNKVHGVSFHGNGVVKTINVHDFYELYETIRNISLKRRLNNISNE